MNNKGKRIQKCLESPKEKIVLTNRGAICVESGEHTGRCPHAKFIVKDKMTEKTVDWTANQAMSKEEWKMSELSSSNQS